ncbi:MAG TPA: hypothetical protein VIF38_13645, partial [Burkholderiales bacterium]
MEALIFFGVFIALIWFLTALGGRGRRFGARDFDRDVDTQRWSLELLHALEWKRFEIVCSGYFEAIGFRARTARA